jgi:tetratricopeptide (TPR) repeat protein
MKPKSGANGALPWALAFATCALAACVSPSQLDVASPPKRAPTTPITAPTAAASSPLQQRAAPAPAIAPAAPLLAPPKVYTRIAGATPTADEIAVDREIDALLAEAMLIYDKREADPKNVLRAIQKNESALNVGLKFFGPNHPLIAVLHDNVAILQEAWGYGDAAVNHRTLALAIRRIQPTPNNAEHSDGLLKLGHALMAAERYDEAERTLKDALAKAEQHWGPKAAELIPSLVTLSQYYRIIAKNDSAAEGLMARARQIEADTQ